MGCRERLRRVVYDTSILMLLYDGVDVFESAAEALATKPECVILKPTLEELEKLAESKSIRKRRAARLALTEIEKRKCRIVEAEGPADDAIVRYVVGDCEAVVATADRELRRRLREKGIPHLFYKSDRRSLMLEGA